MLKKLNAKRLDKWQEYELHTIIDKSDPLGTIDIEPIILLKMKCPSTDLFYTLRVPPNIKKCEEALNYINWGFKKEELIWET